MKTKLIFLYILACVNLQGQIFWQRIETLNDTYLYKIYAMNTDTIFVTGQNLIAKSTDKGINWHRTIIPNNILMRNIVFTNKNNGIAVGDKGTIYKTIDGGTTWSLKTVNTTNNLNAVAETSSGSIWAVGDLGTVLISIDNGETWSVNDFSTLDNLKDIKIYGSEGYIVGQNLSFYKTIDDGNNWVKETQILDDNTIYCIQKTSNNIYILAGNSTRPFVSYKKNNSGTWTTCTGGTGLYVKNDGTGYSLDAGVLTNGGENIITLHKFDNNSEVYEKTIFRSWTYCIDENHTDISLTNDTMIYALSGKVLLKSSPDITDKISKTTNSVIINKESDNCLIFNSYYPFVGYKIMNTYGNLIHSKDFHQEIKETSLNVNNFPKGIYLVKFIFSNKRDEIYKYIIN